MILKVLVCLENAIDPTTVAVNAVTGAIELDRVLPTMNPCDRAGLEWVSSIVNRYPDDVAAAAVSVGGSEANGLLREAYSQGVKDLHRIADIRGDPLGPSFEGGIKIGNLLAQATRNEGAQLVVTGERGALWGSGMVPAVMAKALHWPYLPDIVKVEEFYPGTGAVVRRELKGGAWERWKIDFPAVLGFKSLERPVPVVEFGRWVEAATVPIPVSAGALVTGPSLTVRWSAPSPRAKDITHPDYKADVWTRVDQIVAGDTPRKNGKVVTGDADMLAQSLISYLIDRNYISEGI